MASRLSQLASHLSPYNADNQALSKILAKNDDDVVIVSATRTPFCKARKGGLKDMRYDELLTAVFKAILAKSQVDPKVIDDVQVGSVLPPGAAYYARAAALAAGIPDTTPVQTVNRFCSSGLMAVRAVATQIIAGEIECGLAVGAESMTDFPDRGVKEYSDEIMSHPVAKDCIMPMGWTSENVARDFNVTREKQDRFAAQSHVRAARAQATGVFSEEITPIEVPVVTKDANGKVVKKEWKMVKADDGIRPDSTPEKLSKIRAAFPQWGEGTTGGNASQITDGAAAVLLMRRSKAKALGLPILAKYAGVAVSGLPPRIMGIGPVFAIRKLLEQTGIRKDQVDVYEINEAFASQAVYCVEELGLDPAKVNPNGGAIALGHPLGATGARLVVTGLGELKRRGGKVLVTSMCIGLGMGAAGVFVRED